VAKSLNVNHIPSYSNNDWWISASFYNTISHENSTNRSHHNSV